MQNTDGCAKMIVLNYLTFLWFTVSRTNFYSLTKRNFFCKERIQQHFSCATIHIWLKQFQREKIIVAELGLYAHQKNATA